VRIDLLLAVGLIASLGACTPNVSGAEVPGAIGSEAAMRYLALGDSYTIGQGLQAESRWPALLLSARGEAGCGEYALTMVARTGWTAGELLSEVRGQQLTGPFDLISLQVGVNDQYRGRPVEEFHSDLGRLLEEVRRLAGAHLERVLVVSIPDWSESPFGGNSAASTVPAEIDAFNSELVRMAGEFGFRFVDVTDLTRAEGMGSDMFTPDGLHYSRAMNERWVERILPEACSASRGG
jgi:lysophospholipase L1-like esterase